MSSEKNSNPELLSGNKIGWSSGLRIALILTLIYVLISSLIYVITYRALFRTLTQAEHEVVKTHAEEYSNWFLEGQIETLEKRMNQLSVQDGEIKFVHISGPGLNYLKYISSDPSSLSAQDLNDLANPADGVDIPLSGKLWTIASAPVGDSGIRIQAGKNDYLKQQSLTKFNEHFLLILIPATLSFIATGFFLIYSNLLPIRRLVTTIRNILSKGDFSRRADTVKGENELNALVHLFNHLLDKNESLMLNMRKTLDHVAHDFRTPLSHLSITAEQTLGKKSTLEETRAALADCAEETQNLRHMMDTVMDVAEAESDTLKIRSESVEIQSLIASVIDVYEFVAEEKNIAIHPNLPNEPLTIQADPSRLTRALANLLDNAIKYSPENSTIQINTKANKNKLSITFQDQGCGISADELPLIWQRLYRAEKSRTSKGLGLGLNYVKAIIEAHGGTITAESQPEQGSIFKITLPIQTNQSIK